MEEDKLNLNEQNERDEEIHSAPPLIVQSILSIADPKYKPVSLTDHKREDQTVFIPDIGWL